MYFHSPPYMQTGFSIFINIAVATGDNAAWQIASGPLQARRALDAWVPHGHGHGHGHVHGHARGYLLEQPQEPIQPICRFFLFSFVLTATPLPSTSACLHSPPPPLCGPRGTAGVIWYSWRRTGRNYIGCNARIQQPRKAAGRVVWLRYACAALPLCSLSTRCLCTITLFHAPPLPLIACCCSLHLVCCAHPQWTHTLTLLLLLLLLV